MQRIRALIKKYPLAALALMLGGGFLVVTTVTGKEPKRPPTTTTAPTPPPGPRPTGPSISAPPPPIPVPGATSQPVNPPTIADPNAGRPDPFMPLVKPQSANAPPPPRGFPAPVPPPLFPGQVPPGAQPLPGGRLSDATRVVGLISGTRFGIAIVTLSGRSYVVARGEMIEKRIRVAEINAKQGLVILIEDGQRFELRTGGVYGPHVATRNRPLSS
jgi:hypothetical protein